MNQEQGGMQLQQNVYVQQDPSNGLGVAGFIVSLVGILTCGLLCPIGLLLSFFGLFKPPRGFAAAGAVIGTIGSLWLSFFGFTLVIGFLGLASVATQVETEAAIAEAVKKIEAHKTERGSLPDSESGQEVIAGLKDGWDNELRYERGSDAEFEVTSAGFDGTFDTADDVSTADSSREPQRTSQVLPPE